MNGSVGEAPLSTTFVCNLNSLVFFFFFFVCLLSTFSLFNNQPVFAVGIRVACISCFFFFFWFPHNITSWCIAHHCPLYLQPQAVFSSLLKTWCDLSIAQSNTHFIAMALLLSNLNERCVHSPLFFPLVSP